MGKYGVHFNAFATAVTAKTALGFHADAVGEEGEIVEFAVTGSGSAGPANRQHRAQVAGCTFATNGTRTTLTAKPFNTNGMPARTFAGGEYSAEPTVVGSDFPILMGFNNYSGIRWAVGKGEGLRYNNDRTEKGWVLQVLSDAAAEVDGHGHWFED